MVCFGTARNPEHHTCNCPILKNLSYKLEKRSGSIPSAREAASRVTTDAGLTATGSAPAPAPLPSPESQPGSALIPGAFSAATEPESYDSGDEFDYKGKADGVMYDTRGKHNASSAYLAPSCCIANVEPESGSAELPSFRLLPPHLVPNGGFCLLHGGFHASEGSSGC